MQSMAANDEHAANKGGSESGRFRTFKLDAILYFLVLIVSVIAAITQNPSSVLPRTTMFFDSSRYLDSCKRIYDTFSNLADIKLSTETLDSLAFYLMLDGPILPGAGALLFGILHKEPSLAGWQELVNMQCVFQALASGFVFLLSRKLLDNRWAAVLTATAWALYPAAISACNSFLTEPLAVMLSVGLIYFLHQNQSTEDKLLFSLLKAFFSGLFLASLFLLKPALAPGAGLAFLLSWGFFFFSHAGKAGALAGLKNCLKVRVLLKPSLAALGIAIILVPWLAFTYAARGKVVLMPSRRPVYNIATGCNIEADGWSCQPPHPFTLMYDDNEEPLPVALSLIEANPQEIANLTLRKITRLWNLPWNDYRHKILGLNYRLQALLHLLIAFLGAGGAILFAASTLLTKIAAARKLSFACILIFLGGHFIFLPFEGIGRYGFTSMPFLLIAAAYLVQDLCKASSKKVSLTAFAALFILLVIQTKLDPLPLIMLLVDDPVNASLVRAAFRFVNLALLALMGYKLLSFDKQEKKANLALVSLSALLSFGVLAINTAFALSSSEALSWQSTLKSGEQAQRDVELGDFTSHKPDWVLMIIDGDMKAPEAIYSINKNILSEKPVSLYQFYTEKYELEDWMNQFASLIHKSPEQLARWRAIQIPITYLKNGLNSLACQPGKDGKVTIYGDYIKRTRDGRLLIPSASEASPGKFFNDSEEAFDSRIMQCSYSLPAPSTSKLIKNGNISVHDLSRSAGIQKGDYRLFLLLGYKHKAKAEAAGEKPRTEIFKQNIIGSKSGAIKINGDLESRMQKFEITLPPYLLSGTHLKFKIEGKARAKGTSAGIALAGVVDNKARLVASVLPGTPHLFPLSSSSSSFALESELPVLTIDPKMPQLRLEITGTQGESLVEELNLSAEPEEKANFKGHSIKVF